MRGNPPVSPSLTARTPCHLRLAAASSHASPTACPQHVPRSLARLVQPQGMCSGSHTKRVPDLLCFYLFLLPGTAPELVAGPSSLLGRCWQAVLESSGCWPHTPRPSAPSSGEQLCRGGAASLPPWVRLCPGEGGRCAGWPRGAGEVCGDRTEGCWGVKQRPQWAVPAGAQLLCSPPFLSPCRTGDGHHAKAPGPGPCAVPEVPSRV